MPIMTKQYISRNGQIEYEIDEAGEILTYGRDALGNVVAGYDKNTNAVFTIDYKPFGEFAATTGTITGRRFLWVGTWGYRFTPGVPVSHYVRARHLMMRMGMWTSVDPLWSSEMAYGYVGGSPLSWIDYSGLLKDPLTGPPTRIDFPRPSTFPKPAPVFGNAARFGAIGCLVAVIGWSCYEICTYVREGRPCGPLTKFGDDLGQRLFPGVTELPADPLVRKVRKVTCNSGEGESPFPFIQFRPEGIRHDDCGEKYADCEGQCDRGASRYRGLKYIEAKTCCYNWCQNMAGRCHNGDPPFDDQHFRRTCRGLGTRPTSFD
jgi:RHS repeat-associated protein